MICEICQQDLPEYEFPRPGSHVCSACLRDAPEVPTDAAPVKHLITVHVFMRRLLAFIIDGVILGLVGNGLGFLAFDYFAGIGPWARLIGFGIALVYFGIMDSSVSSGQTPGKRLLKVRVVDAAGKPISPGRAMLRYVIIAVPYFLNYWPAPVGQIVGFVMALILFGLGGSIVYLLVFNRKTRQGGHDLMTGTFVVNSDGDGPVSVENVWRGHAAVPAMLIIAVIALFSMQNKMVEKPLFKKLLAMQRAVLANSDIMNAKVVIGTTYVQGTSSEYLHISALVKHRPDDFQSNAEDLARMIAERFPEELEKDALQVTIEYGYDMGIAHATTHRTKSWNGSEIETLKMQADEATSL